MTPRMYDALTRQWLAREHRALMTATLLANIHRKPYTRAILPEDFLGGRHEAPPPTQSPEEQLAMLKAFTLAMGGTVDLPEGM